MGGGCPETQTQHDDEYLLHVWTTNAVNLPSFFPLQFAAFIYRCFLYFTAPSPAQQTDSRDFLFHFSQIGIRFAGRSTPPIMSDYSSLVQLSASYAGPLRSPSARHSG